MVGLFVSPDLHQSRLAVLQLAPSITSAQLKQHFSQDGFIVTDAKIIYKQDGTSRGLGFVGYKVGEEANRARDHFDGTWIGGRRIKVEVAREARTVLTNRPTKRLKVSHGDADSAERAIQPHFQTKEGSDDAAYRVSRMRKLLTQIDAPPEEVEIDDREKAKAIDANVRRLFLRNLPFSGTADDIRSVLQQYGAIEDVHVIIDKQTACSKGLAYVTFREPDAACKVLAELDGTPLLGRLVHILPAIDRSETELSVEPSVATLQHSRSERRRFIGKWANVYLNADAVAQAAAAKSRINKSDVVGPEVGDPALRLALAETTLIAESKDFLAQYGIDADAVTPRSRRSETTILVKNLPFATSSSTLEGLFSTYGSIANLAVSPSGIMAIIEFSQSANATEAMRDLAYRRLGNAPIYLEPAPLTLLAATMRRTKQDSRAIRRPLQAEATLYLKNLAFETTDDALANAIGHLAGFCFARVQTRDMPQRPGRRMSMGFGFAGFETDTDAKNALEAINGLSIHGHALKADLARRGGSPEPLNGKEESEGKSRKVVIKNLAFEATRNDVRDLCSAHAKVKSVRMPRKADRKTRGFAFVEFNSKRDAETAISALKHVHLLGRHLIFQYALDSNAEHFNKTAEEMRLLTDEQAFPSKKPRSRGIEATLSSFSQNREKASRNSADTDLV